MRRYSPWGGKEVTTLRGKKSNRNANGSGSIRKKEITRNGKTYAYWQGRYTVGYDSTGKQIQRSVNGKTRAEVAKRLREIASEIDRGTYTTPCEMTLSKWVDIWSDDYVADVRPSTAYLYKRNLILYVLPELGDIRLDRLTTQMIQHLYNELHGPKSSDRRPLQPKSIKNLHGVLHKVLEQAVKNGFIKENPSNACVLPKIERHEIKPLEPEQIVALLKAIKGHPHECYYKIALYSGLREGELLGLTWNCVDFECGTITVKQQLKKSQEKGGGYYVAPTKNGKQRIIALAPSVLEVFQQQKEKLDAMKANAGSLWIKCPALHTLPDGNEHCYDFVFRNEIGDRLSYRTVYDCFKRIVASIGMENVRIHDLRHTFAVISLANGDDIKTVQENLGHATASFTLDVYGHVSKTMQKESANRMERFIQNISGMEEQ